MSFYSVCKKLLSGILKFGFRIKIEGAENEPTGGAYLICANHISLADPIILGVSLKGNPKYMAKKELTRVPIIGHLVKALGAFPVERGGNDVGAIKKTIEFLKEGQPVIMFPQGTRYKGVNPKETKVKNGCAMISKRAEAPILPIYIHTKGFKVRLFKRTVVRIGKPIMQSELNETMTGPEDYRSSAEFIFSRITSMAEGLK